jgi:hypothetical protein
MLAMTVVMPNAHLLRRSDQPRLKVDIDEEDEHLHDRHRRPAAQSGARNGPQGTLVLTEARRDVEANKRHGERVDHEHGDREDNRVVVREQRGAELDRYAGGGYQNV